MKNFIFLQTARIWKYAAMLLMVLTIGVGEM